jgi:glycosyltransferase involved in cell wall biosynthesis
MSNLEEIPPALSVVVPVFNAERSLGQLVEEIDRALGGSTFELILVNDGSRDQSWNVIEELASKYRWIRGFDLMRNYGQHNALLCGIRQARHQITATIDDDLQNPPAEIPKLLKKLAEGYDVVYGAPRQQMHGMRRNLASRVTKMVLGGAMGAETARNISAFRVFRTRLREAFAEYCNPYVSIDVLLTWGTQRFTSVSVAHHPRVTGISNYTWRKLVVHALNMATGFSVIPLQVASLLGFSFTLFGLVVLALVLVRYLVQGGSVPGFAFLASTIAIFSGAQLFALGIIGEYIARIHLRTMNRPPYAVRAEGATGIEPDSRAFGEQEPASTVKLN